METCSSMWGSPLQVWNTFLIPDLHGGCTWRWRGSVLCQWRRGVSHLSSSVRRVCSKLWTRLLATAVNYSVLSLPCQANEACDQTDLPVNALPLNYLRLCNWCIVILIKPKGYAVSYFLHVTENPFSHLLFSFYFQVSVRFLFLDNFVTAIFSKFEVYVSTRQPLKCVQTS